MNKYLSFLYTEDQVKEFESKRDCCAENGELHLTVPIVDRDLEVVEYAHMKLKALYDDRKHPIAYFGQADLDYDRSA